MACFSPSQEVARTYTDIEFNDVIIDNLCMQLVRIPGNMMLWFLPNLYGDIVSDLCASLVGVWG